MSTELAVPASNCRFCQAPLNHLVVDLGLSPLCESRILPEQLNTMEPFYPLRVHVCENCFLVQLDEYVSPDEIFTEYAYFSSNSTSWVEHARRYAEQMRTELGLGSDSLVMEIASNDGYLLQHFANQNIPVLGIEPAANVAEVARAKGVKTEVAFLGENTAREIAASYGKADLLLGNNVLAHVPDINDFVAGMKLLLKPDGVITMEFPHLKNMMELNQFDTIYHEHFSYLSWFAVEQIFAAKGLVLFHVEELPTHGGSLRIYARHQDDFSKPVSSAAAALTKSEIDWGVNKLETYTRYTDQVQRTKRELLSFLIEQKNQNKKVVGYGAPGKGNTLLNYCGIRTDLLEFTVDRNSYKQNSFTPGTRIPVLSPEAIEEARPDFVLVLPWNLRAEISEQLAYIKDWGGKLVFPIPELEVVTPG
ncbi:MAG: methyltransferase domain-containing protein [Thiotrichales bacterium]